ncbi:MAG TPA: tetratricopeptide repeat protein [Thermoanaerobaculia bacterium]
MALFDAGNAVAARSLLARVVELQPDNAAAHYKLGLCCVNTGDAVEAREHLRRFLELAPEDPEAASVEEMLAYLE